MRVHGAFDPDHFLDDSPWDADTVWHRGEARRRGVAEDSGFTVVVSAADFNAFAEQVRDAVAFLRDHAGEVSRLRSLPGVAGVTLDFGTAQRDAPAWSLSLPAELTELAGRHRVGIELSLYAVSSTNPVGLSPSSG